jgi:hypothetical protein
MHRNPLDPVLAAALAIGLALPAWAQLPTAPSSLTGASQTSRSTPVQRVAPATVAPPVGMPMAATASPQPAAVATPAQRSQAGASAPRMGQEVCGLNGDTQPHAQRVTEGDAGAAVPHHGVSNQRSAAQVRVSGGYSPPRRALAPGVAFEIVGRGFGAEPGQVLLRWGDGAPAGGAHGAMTMQRRSEPTAVEVLSWADGRITARLPADFSGRAPGPVQLRVQSRVQPPVQPTAATQTSNALASAFWPRWEYHTLAELNLQPKVAQCADVSPAQPGACRAGTSQVAPLPEFQRATRYADTHLVEAAHLCPAQGRRCPGPPGHSDLYELDLPPWAVPVISAFDYHVQDERHDTPPHLSMAPAPADDAPRSKPQRYTLQVNWSAPEAGDDVAYVVGVAIAMPRGLAPLGLRAHRSVVPGTATGISTRKLKVTP